MKRALQVGDKVHIYDYRHYNWRGRVVAVREVDALGRIDVQAKGQLIRCHECDLELVPEEPGAEPPSGEFRPGPLAIGLILAGPMMKGGGE